MAAPKKIYVNPSSLIDLKAELFRKHEALKAEKLRRDLGQFSKETVSGIKEKKANKEAKQNSGVQERAKKDIEQVASVEEIDMLRKSREMLEKKTRIYDTLTNGKVLPDDDVKELYLVDFERKVLHDAKKQHLDECKKEEEISTEEIPPPSGPDDEWVDYVDALGRSRRCLRRDLPDLREMDKQLRDHRNNTSQESKDEENELSRSNDNSKSEEHVDVPTGPIHYQTVQHKEIRTHGVGYFSFSVDEEQRKLQIESLNNLRDQTLQQRTARERLKGKRKLALKARLAKVKQRKGIELEESNESESDEEVAVKEEPLLEEEAKKEVKPRPWDIGKVLPPVHRKQQFTQRGWIEKKRGERLQEFAPPQLYNLDDATFNNSFQTQDILQSRNCLNDQNTENTFSTNMTTQDDVERIIAETVTYYKNKTK